MELRVLEYFLTVAQEGSVSAAAQVLGLTQPTLSRQLIDLEKELGVTLFKRGHYGITLTPQGMALKQKSEQIVDLVHEAQDQVSSAGDLPRGEVGIACSQTGAFGLLAQAMAETRQEYPDITFKVSWADDYGLVGMLNEGLVDFALLSLPPASEDYDSLALPYQDKWGLLMKADDPRAKEGEGIAGGELMKLPLLVSRQWEESAGLRLPGQGQARRKKMDIIATYTVASQAAAMVRAGLGYALITEGVAKDRVEDAHSGLRFTPLKTNPSSQPSLIWLKRRDQPASASAFRQKVKEICAA